MDVLFHWRIVYTRRRKQDTRLRFGTSSKQVGIATKRRLIAKLLWPSSTFSSFSSRVFSAATRIFRFERTIRWLKIGIDEDGWKIEMLIDDDRWPTWRQTNILSFRMIMKWVANVIERDGREMELAKQSEVSRIS